MGVEIERKFLVISGEWNPEGAGIPFRQGYLCTDSERSVRVRVVEGRGFLTIKGAAEAGARAEYEYSIPEYEAAQMLDTLCRQPIIHKVRYRVPYHGHIWEVDEFFGENAGLLLAEVELTDIAEAVDLPRWVGQEVTDDPRYYNAYLCRHPFASWEDATP